MGQALVQVPLFLVCLIAMMSVVIIVHELGHYWVARWNGAAIRSFSVGFGNSIFEHIDKRGTGWKISAIPFGGFVSFVEAPGLQVREGVQPVGTPFGELKPLQRIAVSLGGPLANFLLAIAIFSLTLFLFGKQTYSVGIAGLAPGGAAERGGLLPGDIFVSANGREIKGADGVIRAVILNPNVPIRFEVERENQRVNVMVTPEEKVRPNELGQNVKQATIGVEMARLTDPEVIRFNPISAIGQGVVETGDIIRANYTMLGRIITGKMSLHTMSGPVGIGDISRRVVNSVWTIPELTTGQKLYQLFWSLISMCAAISIGLGAFNLLPFPMLDGGAVATETWQLASRRAISGGLIEKTRLAGAALLMLLILVITLGDVFETGIFTRGGP